MSDQQNDPGTPQATQDVEEDGQDGPEPLAADATKTGSQKQGVRRGRQITARQTLAVLAEDEPTRSAVMARFKAAGGSLDRWLIADMGAMAEAITRVEDELEMRPTTERRLALRMTLRDLRRKLEVAVWP